MSSEEPKPPEQSTAEHIAAVLQATRPVETLTQDRLAHVAHPDFPVVLRGYDRVEVDRYVKRVIEIVRELEATSSPPAAIRQALERVGDEVADILKRAHATATEVTSAANAEAEGRLAGVKDEAATILKEAQETLANARTEAETRVSSARAEATDALDRARAEAARLVDEARVEADRRRLALRSEVEEIELEGQRRIKELDADADRVWVERQRILDDVRMLAGQLESLVDSAIEQFPEDDDDSTTVMPAPELLRPAPPDEDHGDNPHPVRAPLGAPDETAPTVTTAPILRAVSPPAPVREGVFDEDVDPDATVAFRPADIVASEAEEGVSGESDSHGHGHGEEHRPEDPGGG